jgi:hypothetical protein
MRSCRFAFAYAKKDTPELPFILAAMPLKPGLSWSYRRSYEFGGNYWGEIRKSTSIRTFTVLEDSNLGSGKRYRIRISDSVLGFELKNHAPQPPLEGFGENGAWDLAVFDTANGALGTAWIGSDTNGIHRGSEVKDDMLAQMFHSHGYRPYLVSDTTPDHSQPEFYSRTHLIGLRKKFLIRKDIGLVNYGYFRSSYKFDETWQYDLIEFKDGDKVVPIALAQNLQRKGDSRPRLRFNGAKMEVLGHGVDGRRTVVPKE